MADFGRFGGPHPRTMSTGFWQKWPIRARKLVDGCLPSGMERRLPEREVVEAGGIEPPSEDPAAPVTTSVVDI